MASVRGAQLATDTHHREHTPRKRRNGGEPLRSGSAARRWEGQDLRRPGRARSVVFWRQSRFVVARQRGPSRSRAPWHAGGLVPRGLQCGNLWSRRGDSGGGLCSLAQWRVSMSLLGLPGLGKVDGTARRPTT